ncbi:transcriptional regulator [Candidatus Bathyarchaeota archaeon]|nr:transcriptional regulator [Candidatus Bathyarchaeota archaeon]MBS7613402.1 transcriptional regulator [Candidatus Bathyarchaeota archaeon]MBS7613403.1 transcriptional regulator [Candidatus Bathyarchaeota archaeon]MBS7618228.1 transcriptional regulator [Candidatus Bathyarchaeota archaeon]
MHLKPPCELSVKFILPAIRLLIAKKLIEKYNFTQTSAAKALGTTQAAISHYMHSKRGWRLAERLMKMEDVREFIEKSAEKIATSEIHNVDVLDVCQLCKITQKYVSEFEKS